MTGPVSPAGNEGRKAVVTPKSPPQEVEGAVAWRVWSAEGEGGLFYHEDVARENASETSYVEPLYAAPAVSREEIVDLLSVRFAKLKDSVVVQTAADAVLALLQGEGGR